jgi:hypothetical protein
MQLQIMADIPARKDFVASPQMHLGLYFSFDYLHTNIFRSLSKVTLLSSLNPYSIPVSIIRIVCSLSLALKCVRF